MTPQAVPQRISIRSALREKRNVMSAVILRDMRTRFFNHGLGFLMVSVWPLMHMLALLTIYTFLGRRSPFGESLNIFFATGLLPTLSFMYVSRFMSVSLIINRSMLAFPVVSVVDIMIARAFLEISASAITVFLMFAILLAIGDNPFPFDPLQACFAYLAALLIAIGTGCVVGILVMFMPFVANLYAILMMPMYLLSGILFVPSALPEKVARALSWNPIFQTVEWMRSAFYPSYPAFFLDKPYTIGFGMTALCIGLTLERLLRRRMLES